MKQYRRSVSWDSLSSLFIVVIILFGFIHQSQSSDVLENQGKFESACNATSDCQLELVCQSQKCVCDSSYFFDSIKNACKKICLGSQEGLMIHANSDHHYNLYKDRYTNCTYVAGNLEITNLDRNYDLSFLSEIEEVRGYVLIVNVYSNYLNLTSLRIIRGYTLFELFNVTYSLYVALNHNVRNDSEGILELQFVSLSEIGRGHVYFHNNNLLCFVNTIYWDDINPTTTPPVQLVFNSLHYLRTCPPCPEECYHPSTRTYHCWGSGPNMCQKLNYVKEVCHETCDGRCFGKQQNECCHPECSAGCIGRKKTDCFSCKNFYNEGQCQPFCPNLKFFDQNLMKSVNNPDGRYAFQSLCVRDCPPHLVKDNGACVIRCPNGKRAEHGSNVCTECPDKICPKHCDGVDSSEFISAKNIESFRGCTIVDKNVQLFRMSFDGDLHKKTRGINASDLAILKDIREITGFLSIQEAPAEVTDLSFLSGLEIIYGRYLLSKRFSLHIASMAIEHIGLTSLRQIKNGDVMIYSNPKLCYVNNLDMTPLFTEPNQKMRIRRNNSPRCDKNELQCHAQCSKYGCWGPGPDKCLQCKNVQIHQKNICLDSCAEVPMLYDAGNGTCKQCFEQCADGCTGPHADECFTCQQVKVLRQNNTFECMSVCPILQQDQPYLYPDDKSICRSCDLSCEVGCTGPSPDVRIGGCNTCFLAINRTHENGTVHCLPLNQTDYCPHGYYEQQYKSDVPHPLSRKRVCQPCDHLCRTCTSSGLTNCLKCRYYRNIIGHYSTCVEECPKLTYSTMDNTCFPCHEQCYLGCRGPYNTDCINCANFKVVINAENSSFLCVHNCPKELPFLVEDTDSAKPSRTVCTDDIPTSAQKQRETFRKRTYSELCRNMTYPELSRNRTYPELSRNRTYPELFRNITYQEFCRNRTYPELSINRTYPELPRNRTYPELSRNRTYPGLSRNRTYPGLS